MGLATVAATVSPLLIFRAIFFGENSKNRLSEVPTVAA
jgi:hypothetical protein